MEINMTTKKTIEAQCLEQLIILNENVKKVINLLENPMIQVQELSQVKAEIFKGLTKEELKDMKKVDDET
jgi:hypothetical protein